MSENLTQPTTPEYASVSVLPVESVDGSIRPPGSKSLTNRALICAAMAKGQSEILGALRSEDTEVMTESLRRCGIGIEVESAGKRLIVQGRQQPMNPEVRSELFIANSGTSVRFLTAALSALGGKYLLSGVPRMHERPIEDLVNALKEVQVGGIRCLSAEGCPPVEIDSDGWNGNVIRVAGSVSSQYLSGLMMAAPVALGARREHVSRTDADTIRIEVVGELVSRPYVEMTATVMESFGSQVRLIDEEASARADVSLTVEVSGSGYKGVGYPIEPDASAASYFWAAAAITGGNVKVLGLSPDALQGDVGFCHVLEEMGCTLAIDSEGMAISGRACHGIDIDMNAISDTVQTLSVVALFADSPTRVRGVAHNRFKETDRIGDLARELRKLGATVEEHEDGLTIIPPPDGVKSAVLETYHDHRMAMSLSLAGLSAEGVRVLDPACTGKTYPEFFADLEALTGKAHHWSTLDGSRRV